jgi:hypothetical protein
MGQGSCGNYGNEIAGRLAKEAAEKENTIIYSKVPRNIIKSEIQKNKHRKVAKRMGHINKRKRNQKHFYKHHR